MNGPIILKDASEYLAHEISAYRAPTPEPFKISPWVAMSCLQKAVRRGEIELAQRAAAIDPRFSLGVESLTSN